MNFKLKFYDWLWWNIGEWFWKKSARNHPQSEVKRRLNWMTLDCIENTKITKFSTNK